MWGRVFKSGVGWGMRGVWSLTVGSGSWVECGECEEGVERGGVAGSG